MPTERSFKRTARIERPPSEVWAFMTTLENSPKWIAGVTATTKVSDGPIGPGSVIRETRTIGKRTETYDINISAFDPPRLYGASVKAGKAEFVYRFELKDARGATDIEMVASAKGSGLVAKMFIGMGMKFMEKHDGNQLEQLKRAVESGG